MKRQFVCTRPKLATELIKRGHKPSVEPSPWNEKRTAWIFQVDEDLEKTVAEYYHQIGKRSPLETFVEVEKRLTKDGKEVRHAII